MAGPEKLRKIPLDVRPFPPRYDAHGDTDVLPQPVSSQSFWSLTMKIESSENLVAKQCKPCEGGVDACTLDESQLQLEKLDGWELTKDGQRIRKDWRVKNFVAGMEFFNKVTELAEADGHHPDIHLEGYRNVWIELWTHAIGGLSENDFILAAKIDQLDVETA